MTDGPSDFLPTDIGAMPTTHGTITTGGIVLAGTTLGVGTTHGGVPTTGDGITPAIGVGIAHIMVDGWLIGAADRTTLPHITTAIMAWPQVLAMLQGVVACLLTAMRRLPAVLPADGFAKEELRAPTTATAGAQTSTPALHRDAARGLTRVSGPEVSTTAATMPYQPTPVQHVPRVVALPEGLPQATAAPAHPQDA